MPRRMDPVRELVDQLERNPRRFQSTRGYDRLLDALRKGNAPDAVKQALQRNPDFSGDLLWTIAELDDVSAFASDAVHHIKSPDKGTAAYALEIVLRGSMDRGELREAVQVLNSCELVVCEHAVRILAGQGLTRLVEILKLAALDWTLPLAKELSVPPVRRELIEGLVSDPSHDRQTVGAALATLAFELDPSFSDLLKLSEEPWIREYGAWLEGDLEEP